MCISHLDSVLQAFIRNLSISIDKALLSDACYTDSYEKESIIPDSWSLVLGLGGHLRKTMIEPEQARSWTGSILIRQISKT